MAARGHAPALPDFHWNGEASIAPDSVGEIYFAGARDGWAFGPGLWSTHDGGATWHRVDTDGHAVYSLAATNGHVVAAFLSCGTDCGRGAAASFAIETAQVGSDVWGRTTPGRTGASSPTSGCTTAPAVSASPPAGHYSSASDAGRTWATVPVR